jgi:ABC-type Mn2+/Zn2+ transport system permease subunit
MDVSLRKQSAPFWLAAGGLIVMLAGTAGPWITLFGAGTTGASGKGACLIGTAAAAALFLLQHSRDGGRDSALGVIVLGAISVVVCVWALYDITSELHGSLLGGDPRAVQPGWGLWLSSFGSLTVVSASYLMYRDPTY